MERPAIAAYREVLRECPLALEAVLALLQLGLSSRDIQEITLEGLSGCQDVSISTVPPSLVCQVAKMLKLTST